MKLKEILREKLQLDKNKRIEKSRIRMKKTANFEDSDTHTHQLGRESLGKMNENAEMKKYKK